MIVGVTSKGSIYFRAGVDKTHPYGVKWFRVPGALKHVSGDYGKIVGVNKANVIFYRTGVKPAKGGALIKIITNEFG